ncbi:Osmosensitive K+ channel histidine kinase KdpD [Candidatus Hydrogenisulfobacillus filiaventi]|uniref:histidine kinase n=1 Tax=Candidatus Hydrogenisulfobacillus filiaventi TaxID=2707344 RepID=A0A6F8ZG46_9FIRM|nr:ATP-binding protein [Bacillota bacterium]CAB1128750.1 Osmosensitive K+ channel histidine kinase KdpD [Candidatus Hydrogenisulfobacillus filiaventi]
MWAGRGWQWVVALFLLALVAVYWVQEVRLDRWQRKVAELYDQLGSLDLMRSLGQAGPADLPRAVAELLTDLVPRWGLSWAAAWSWQGEGLELVAATREPLPGPGPRVPGALVVPEQGLGVAVRTGRPRYTGREEEAEGFLPGVRSGPWAALPLGEGPPWGVLLLVRTEGGRRGDPWPPEVRAGLERFARQLTLLLAQWQLREERARAETDRRLARLRSELLQTVSHELRTPLGLIKGYSATLRTQADRLAEETRREFLAVIEEEADRLSLQIDRILEASRLEAAGAPLRPEWVSAAGLLREAARRSARTVPGAAAVEVTAEAGMVWGDPQDLGMVLDNLLENALKYGAPPVELRARRQGTEWVFTVADAGQGVEEGEVDRLFERFYRSPRHRTRWRGTGLGLAIARRVVEAHGGRITARNRPGRGLEVEVRLPAGPPVGGREEGAADGP